MSIDVSVTVDLSDLAGVARTELVAMVAEVCKQIAHNALPRMVEMVGQGMRASPEFESLSSGKLREEFGLGTAAGGQVEGREAAESVVEAVEQSVRVDTLPARGDVLGGVFVGAFKEDFSDALAAKWASYTSVGRRGSSPVPWLEWLLFKGDAVVLTGVEILHDYPNRSVSTRKASRTGKDIMVRRNFTGVQGKYNRAVGRSGPSSWRVPPEFSGTASRNWLTNVAQAIAPEVEALLQAEAARF